MYYHPASRYVADFIGEMNFIQSGGGKTIAVRPENVEVLSDLGGEYTGYVRTIMMLGHYIEITVDTEYGLIKAFITAQQAARLSPGDQVSLRLSNCHEYAG